MLWAACKVHLVKQDLRVLKHSFTFLAASRGRNGGFLSLLPLELCLHPLQFYLGVVQHELVSVNLFSISLGALFLTGNALKGPITHVELRLRVLAHRSGREIDPHKRSLPRIFSSQDWFLSHFEMLHRVLLN